MGALELVRTIKANKEDFKSEQAVSRSWKGVVVDKFQQYSQGNIHDVALKDAGFVGMFTFVIPYQGLKLTS